MEVDRICENCKRPYFPRIAWQKYCSPSCRNAAFWMRRAKKSLVEQLDDAIKTGPTELQEEEWKRRGEMVEQVKAKEEAERPDPVLTKALEMLEEKEKPKPRALDKYDPTKE